MEEVNVLTRLLQFISTINISKNKFETLCGLSRGYLTGKTSKPTVIVLERVHAVYPDLNMNWVLFGEGTMLTTEICQPSPVMVSSDSAEISRLKEIIEKKEAKINELNASLTQTLLEYTALLKENQRTA